MNYKIYFENCGCPHKKDWIKEFTAFENFQGDHFKKRMCYECLAKITYNFDQMPILNLRGIKNVNDLHHILSKFYSQGLDGQVSVWADKELINSINGLQFLLDLPFYYGSIYMSMGTVHLFDADLLDWNDFVDEGPEVLKTKT